MVIWKPGQRDRTLPVENSAHLTVAGARVTCVRAVPVCGSLCSPVVGRLLVRGQEADNNKDFPENVQIDGRPSSDREFELCF